MFSFFKGHGNPAARNYVKQCGQAIKFGRPVPAPDSEDELRELLTRWPKHSAPHRPTTEVLRLMGLPADWPTGKGAGQ